MSSVIPTRRHFFELAALSGSGLLLSACATTGKSDAADSDKSDEESIPPTEDLMREHGLLLRAMVIYYDAARRLRGNEEFPMSALTDTASIIRNFVEDYHEKLEEEHLFPRFRKAGNLVDLVQVLYSQHQAGRKVTGLVLQTASQPLNGESREKLAGYLQQFIHMYVPHAAREDTVLFPAFRQIVSDKEFAELGEQFEKREDQLFGQHGFEKQVQKIAAIEQTLGLYDLTRFTPAV